MTIAVICSNEEFNVVLDLLVWVLYFWFGEVEEVCWGWSFVVRLVEWHFISSPCTLTIGVTEEASWDQKKTNKGNKQIHKHIKQC